MASPKLRFKAFDGDWRSVSLLEISTLITKGTTPKQFIEGNINFLKIEAINQNGFDLSKCQTISDEINNKELKRSILMEGDILFAIAGATIGKNAIVQKELLPANTNQALAIIRLKENYSKVFISKVLNSPLMEKYIDINISTGAQPNLNLQQIGSFSFTLPNLEEQTKIATFLSAVDEKISQLSQKLHLLGQYKQGMMQKLFSQQIRFKANDGSEFGEWGKVKFSESFVFHNTNSYSRALLSEVGEVMNIHYGDIHTKFSMLFDVSKEIVPFLNDQIDSTKIAENQFLKEGDLVIADASEVYKDIGKAIEVVHLNNQKVVAGLHTYIARPVQPFALGFCGYLMQTFEVREQIKKLATGTSVLGISKTNIGKVEIKLPSLEEQTKIANFLSSIDQKIEVVAQQIEQAKLWKKGLLQQMFV